MKHKMNRLILCLIIIFALAIAFFPFTTTEVISGKGHVLTLEKEKIGDCELFIEIKDVKSLLMRYRKSFSFVLDGTEFSEFDTYHDDGPVDGWCAIHQTYYDLTISSFDFCLLVYGLPDLVMLVLQSSNIIVLFSSLFLPLCLLISSM